MSRISFFRSSGKSQDVEMQLESITFTPGQSTPHKESNSDLPKIDKATATKWARYLNEDILYLVLEHAYFDELLRPDYPQLAKYALVAKAWREPAQRLIFHEISIKDDRAFKCISRLFSSLPKNSKSAPTDDDLNGSTIQVVSRCEWLRSCVRVLNFWIYKTGRMSNTWETRFANVMTWFPALYELRLGVDVATRLQDSTIAKLNASTAPKLRALQIAMRPAEDGSRPTQSVLPFQLLTAVTKWKLEHLVVRGDNFRLSGHTEFGPVPHQLHEFRWSVQNTTNAKEVDDCISYLTANSHKTLEVIHIPSPLHPIVLQSMATLRSLRVETQYGIPKQLGGLKELIIADKVGSLPKDVSFYSSLPRHIIHLGIFTTYVEDDAAINTLGHKLPQKLQRLSIYTDKVLWDQDAANRRLQEAGRGKVPKTPSITSTDPADRKLLARTWKMLDVNIQVYTWSGDIMSKIGQRSDLVRSTHYPRGVTVENMRYMSRVVGAEDSSGRRRKSIKVGGLDGMKKVFGFS